MFSTFPAVLNFAIFAALAAIIWIAGTRLSYFVDAIAEQTKIARAFLGLILLATATELPEFVTTLTASYSGDASLALNNMFGGILSQLLVLAVADYFVKDGTLTSQPHSPTVMVAGLLCIVSMAFVFIVLGSGDYALAYQTGVGTVIVASLYVGSMYVLKQMEGRSVWSPVDLPDEHPGEQGRHNKYDNKSLGYLISVSAVAAVFILICGVSLVQIADALATQTGLGNSFVGASLLAITTSLPELSTSIAAVRVKAYTMAISNVFGSNLIMIFLLFPNDLMFREGLIIEEIDKPAQFAMGAAIVMTGIYCIALLARPKRKLLGVGVASLVLVACYVVSLWGLYALR